MKKESNVTSLKYCCGICTSVCPRGILTMKLDNNGFYKPYTENQHQCIECGLCLDVCAFKHKELALSHSKTDSWAAWSNDEAVRKKCSSGGIGFEIGRQLILRGYGVVGSRYNIEKQRAEHYIATTVEEFVQSIGSKYIQSYTEDALKLIKRKGHKYLVTGTPCQIDSFRRMIQKFHCEENFVLLDFFCHSVPSKFVWDSYLKKQEHVLGKIIYASWRNKYHYGWHDSWVMGLDGTKTSKPINWNDSYENLIKERTCTIQSRWTTGDMFYKLFLGDMCSGIHCEKDCKYKYDKSSADIRIGDLWGNTYKADEKGVSALIAFTETGKQVINSLINVTLTEHPFKIVAEGQMIQNAKPALMKPIILFFLRHGVSLDSILFKTVYNVQRGINVLKMKIRRII